MQTTVQKRSGCLTHLLCLIALICGAPPTWADCENGGTSDGAITVTICPQRVHSDDDHLDEGDRIEIGAVPGPTHKIVQVEIRSDGGTVHRVATSESGVSMPITLQVKRADADTFDWKLGDVLRLKPGLRVLEVKACDEQSQCGWAVRPTALRTAEKFAIVIGVNDFVSATHLNYARSDAYEIADYLLGTLGIPARNLWLLTDNSDEAAAWMRTAGRDQPNNVSLIETDSVYQGPEKISQAFLAIGDRISRQSALFFYFSGHQFVTDQPGLEEHFYFLLPKSQTAPGTEQSRFAWSSLTKAFTSLGLANGAVVLDSCYSGGTDYAPVVVYENNGSSSVPQGQKGSPQKVTQQLTRMELPRAIAWVGSSRGDELSFELESKKHGAFTQALLEVARVARKRGLSLSIDNAIYGVKSQALEGAASLTHGYVDEDICNKKKDCQYHQDPVIFPAPWSHQDGSWVP